MMPRKNRLWRLILQPFNKRYATKHAFPSWQRARRSGSLIGPYTRLFRREGVRKRRQSRERRVDFIWKLRQGDSMARSLRVLEDRNGNTLGSRHGWKKKVCQRRFGWPTAFVAETYGWLTGRPAVCISALGPGSFNFCFISSTLCGGGVRTAERPRR